jgi:hypothetical protein
LQGRSSGVSLSADVDGGSVPFCPDTVRYVGIDSELAWFASRTPLRVVRSGRMRVRAEFATAASGGGELRCVKNPGQILGC